jgi:flavin-dependent dehydrogenase
MNPTDWEKTLQPQGTTDDLRLDEGSRVAVVGGGPAGSLFGYFLLEMANRVGMEVDVDIYEPRDFNQPAPRGCNMCGGIVSETLVQNLAAEGINLPPAVVRRGIDSYVLHMDVGSVRIATPLQEMRIGAVTRGPGPRDVSKRKWGSFDQHLITLAQEKGAQRIPGRVVDVGMEKGRPQLRAEGGTSQPYDLVAVGIGVNSRSLQLFEALGLGYRRPKATKTLIREYFLGQEVIGKTLGSSMHVFLLDIPRLEFAAIIPKGDYVSMCLLGDEIDNSLVEAFVESPEVKRCMPPEWRSDERSCQCMPRISVRGVKKPYADRVVFIGDCGVTRLYKDGIGAAYRTAKAAARTAVFEGISENAFRQHYLPTCRNLVNDNAVGKAIFLGARLLQKLRFARRAVLRMTVSEQRKGGRRRRMSGVLWDMFSGSAPYRDILLRGMHPAFAVRLLGALLGSVLFCAPRKTDSKVELK